MKTNEKRLADSIFGEVSNVVREFKKGSRYFGTEKTVVEILKERMDFRNFEGKLFMVKRAAASQIISDWNVVIHHFDTVKDEMGIEYASEMAITVADDKLESWDDESVVSPAEWFAKKACAIYRTGRKENK